MRMVGSYKSMNGGMFTKVSPQTGLIDTPGTTTTSTYEFTVNSSLSNSVFVIAQDDLIPSQFDFSSTFTETFETWEIFLSISHDIPSKIVINSRESYFGNFTFKSCDSPR